MSRLRGPPSTAPRAGESAGRRTTNRRVGLELKKSSGIHLYFTTPARLIATEGEGQWKPVIQ
jgi:hypothetical protein